jgi:hypothetical protein
MVLATRCTTALTLTSFHPNGASVETIVLYRTPQGWMSRTDNPQVAELFGTDTLPTAFTADAPADDVLAAIQKLNPDAYVLVSDRILAS